MHALMHTLTHAHTLTRTRACLNECIAIGADYLHLQIFLNMEQWMQDVLESAGVRIDTLLHLLEETAD